MSEHDDLERRLRAALHAKAEQITDADLDLAREDEVAEQVRAVSHPRRRFFASAGVAAAAAAIVGVAVFAIHPGDHRQPVNAASHFTTSAGPTTTSTLDGVGTDTGSAGPRMSQQVNSVSGARSSLQRPPTERSNSAASPPMSRATPHGTGLSQTSPKSGLGQPGPPAMPAGLPQAGPLGSGKYAGPVPITDASGGPTRMLSMPDGTQWEVLSQSDTSLTVRITDLPTDIEAYWAKTLPGLGWAQTDGGWHFPKTSYAVSAISDKGSFTVSW